MSARIWILSGKPIVGLGLAAAISGCGVTLQSHKVATLKQENAAPGIYYSLPKTAISVSIPARLEVRASGRVGAVYEDCLKACKAGGAGATPSQCVLPAAQALRFMRPDVQAKGIPDPDHTYYTTMSAEMFSSIKHAMTFDDAGVAVEGSTSGTNMTFEVVASVIGAVARAALGPSLLMTKDRTPQAAVTTPERLTCTAAQNIEKELKDFPDRIKAERKKADDWLASLQGGSANADLAKLVLDRSNERITVIREELAQYRTGKDLDPLVKKSFSYVLRVTEPIVPTAFETYPDAKGIPKTLDIRVEAPSIDDQVGAPAIKEILEDNVAFKAMIKSVTPFPAPCNAGDGCRIGDPAGYRYRVPATGLLTITVNADKKNKGTDEILFEERLSIAQWGPVVALPSRFEGKGGSVEFAISPTSGALKKVGIGTEALPATAVGAPLDSIVNSLEERRKRKEAEADEAVTADLKELERERDALKAQKEIRDLKKELGL